MDIFLGGFILFRESIIVALPSGKYSMAVVNHTRVTEQATLHAESQTQQLRNLQKCIYSFIHERALCANGEGSLDPTPQDSEKCDWS